MLFRSDVSKVFQKPLEIRQQWLRWVQAARTKSHNAQGGLHHERKLMANWLGRATGP
jgi:hypothetical protein